MDYFLIVFGFILLTFSADGLVNGASSLAKRLNVPDLVIGLTIVAFGTSAPEMVVNLAAAINNTSEVAFTNILGSNSINTFVVLGLAAVIFPLAAQRSTVRIEIPLSFLAAVLVLVLGAGWGLSRWEGIILLFFFVGFIYHSLKLIKKEPKQKSEEIIKPMKMGWAIALIVGGLAGLVIGGDVIVRSAVRIATHWGVSEALVGVTIVALGTSLPEMATSVIAASKHKTDLAIGNVIGSNIFNVFCILGTSAVIRPLPAYPNLALDASMAALSSLMVFIFVFIGKKHAIKRYQGALLLAVYGIYLAYLIYQAVAAKSI